MVWGLCSFVCVFAICLHIIPNRCILLMMLAVCAGGVTVIENPGTSLIYLHDRWQWMLQRLHEAKIPASVTHYP